MTALLVLAVAAADLQIELVGKMVSGGSKAGNLTIIEVAARIISQGQVGQTPPGREIGRYQRLVRKAVLVVIKGADDPLERLAAWRSKADFLSQPVGATVVENKRAEVRRAGI